MQTPLVLAYSIKQLGINLIKNVQNRTTKMESCMKFMDRKTEFLRWWLS